MTPEEITDSVCQYMGMSKRGVLAKIRTAEFVECRMICMYLSFKWWRSNYAKVGIYFDMSEFGVRHAVGTISGYKSVDKEFRRKLEMIERHVQFNHIQQMDAVEAESELVKV